MRSRTVAKLCSPLLVAGLASTACYEATSLRLRVQSPPTALDCARVADQVFFGAAFQRSNISGPDIFYTPRISPTAGLGWGIAVWLKGAGPPASGNRCEFELETLAADLGCGVLCAYSPQRGAEFDQTLKDMTRRLSAAFGDTGPPQ